MLKKPIQLLFGKKFIFLGIWKTSHFKNLMDAKSQDVILMKVKIFKDRIITKILKVFSHKFSTFLRLISEIF